MDTLINNQEHIDLGTPEINKITDNGAKIIVYHDLASVGSLQTLTQEYGACIILYETKKNFGHWVCLIDQGDFFEFFDSYGFSPDQELKYAVYDNTPYLTRLIQNSKKPVRANKVRLQSVVEDTNTCGRWASVRVRMRHIPIQKFVSLFKNNKAYTPDFFVSAITFLTTFH